MTCSCVGNDACLVRLNGGITNPIKTLKTTFTTHKLSPLTSMWRITHGKLGKA